MNWHQQYKCCAQCGQTNYKHHAKGLCEHCYGDKTEARHRPGRFKPDEVTACCQCKELFTDVRPYYDAGYCYECFKVAPPTEEETSAWNLKHPKNTAKKPNIHRLARSSASRMGATFCAERIGVDLTLFRNWCSGHPVPKEFLAPLGQLFSESRKWTRDR